MSIPILATKLYIPQPRSNLVLRPRLIEQLNEGLARPLTLISAPAGFGKTTLVSEWVASCGRPVAWLSLDETDNDPTRFLTYLIAALQTVAPQLGTGLLLALQSPQPPATEALLTALLNELTTLAEKFVLVLDDYHLLDAPAIDAALAFLLKHLPPQLHLVIATREDPPLPLARLRARAHLTELRLADLRFTLAEVSGFLNQAMGLKLAPAEIAALESRTEGWIAGLQLAAISLQGHKDTTSFIKSFTGSHYFVLDYLVEEVLQQQPADVQTFLVCTAILDRMCGPLCEAVLGDATVSGQATLEYLEHANLFIVPLDNERRWYRYHHLFAELLQQRLQQVGSSPKDSRATEKIAELHIRASHWFETNGLLLEAFRHAAAANDIERAERLVESGGLMLHLRGVVTTVLAWLESLPSTVLDARPALWVQYASLLLVIGQTTGVADKLQAAETALANQKAELESNPKNRNLVGQIAAARATLALTQYQPATIMVQARRALEYLHPANLYFRFFAVWALAFAHFLQGDRAAAGRAYTEALALSQAAGDNFSILLATSALGQMQEFENQLHLATTTYQQVLQLVGEQPLPAACDAYLGLARICYEWNDLTAAAQYGQQSLQLARQYDRVIDRFVVCELFLARLKLANGDMTAATAHLATASQAVQEHNFVQRRSEVAAVQVLILLREGNLATALQLSQTHNLPLSQARVYLAQGDSAAAVALLDTLRQEMETRGWQDERLKVLVAQAIALQAAGKKSAAIQLLRECLTLAEPEGFVRLFVDEGLPMVQLLTTAASQGIMPDYAGRLLAAFGAGTPPQKTATVLRSGSAQAPGEPLSQRELEVIRLIAQGLSNRQISEQLCIALITVKMHNQKIFGKLQVQRRTEAVAQARRLGLL